MTLIFCAVEQSDRPSAEKEKKMCYFPISSVSVPKFDLKTLLWEWGGVGGRYYIGSCRGSLTANEIAKKKRKGIKLI